ncbi:uncharacterized protein PAC_08717 [Phialocephala subalpina]|uniref:Uncharacterized protein n=1 Tax=Phialocephala subalpina TaxID=576137 RepID=A0A1L7X1D0_9HELO|nr:uncharacterized protein PAC_08717 [Phialocephala subalpina]
MPPIPHRVLHFIRVPRPMTLELNPTGAQGTSIMSDPSIDSDPNKDIEVKKAGEKYDEFGHEAEQGKVVNFRGVIDAQENLHLKRPHEWLANLEREQKQKEAKKKQSEEKQPEVNGDQKICEKQDQKGDDGVQQEDEWKQESGEVKHHDAYGTGSNADNEESSGNENEKSEYEKIREKYLPQEIALLLSLQHEKDYISNLKRNNGKAKIPRPLNGEPKLQPLFEAGLITPNKLHYVRNHGAVSHLLWEVHKLDFQGLKPDQKLELTMDHC